MTALEEEFPFPDMRFSRVLSLGADDAGHGPGAAPPDGAATVFDRLASSLDAVVAMLTDDGTRLGLRFVAADAGAAVRCAAYGVRCLDAFRRNEEGGIDFSTGEIERCRADLGASMAAFLRACEDASGAVLFLRREARPGAAVDGLTAALATRFPALEFRLLVEVPVVGQERPHDGRAALVPLPAGGDAWHHLLAGLHLTDPDEAGRSVGGGQPPELPADVQQAVAGAADAAHPSGATPTEGDPEAVLSGLPARLADGSAAPDLAWRIGLKLWRGGRAPRAAEAFALAYAHGCRDLGFLRDHLGLLTGETRYREVIDVAASLRRDGFADHPSAASRLAMLVGHARLALAHPRDVEIARAAERAASPVWLDPPTLLRAIAAAIAERRPFAFTRLGDGEARYLLGEAPVETSGLTDEEAHAMGDLVWENWFGAPLSAVDADRRAALHAAFVDAVRAADVVGVCSHERLRADTGHYGYLAWQEAWLRNLDGGGAARLFTDAQVHYRLNAEAPFLATLLEGQDILGVISPHPGLAEALGRRLSIGQVIEYLIPAEGRLPSAAQMRETLGPHFPQVYDRLMASLTVPRHGCVFLVAAGLLGKIYCARIKALGGIALDIGALVDAWMGFDTRDGQLAQTPRLPTFPPPVHVGERTTYGCLSMGKTGSMALADAVRNAGVPNAVHLHFLGPRAIAIKRANPEPMLDLAIQVADRIADPHHAFRFVTAVRDPIARILSQAFYTAERHHTANGGDIRRDPEALIAWWEAKHMARRDVWSEWFDDTYRTTFGFDFRTHPFDHARKSLRYESGRLRLLVLRQEDDRAGRAAELGWLLDREGVVLRTVNDAANQDYEAAYRPFLEAFVAPAAWLETYYETEVIRHFYTAEERAAFKDRWSGKRVRSRGGTVPVGQASPVGDVGPDGGSRPLGVSGTTRTVLCLSMMKTGSTAIAEALRDTDPGDAVVHLHHLGPLGRATLPALGRPVEAVAARLDDPHHRFAVVTCLRDPIARWISEAFHDAATGDPAGAEFIRDHASFIARVESKRMMDYSTPWFDDSLGTTFGFDFRAHPFDHERGSLRFESERLRLLVLRQEDPTASKEAELGWLLDRERVPLARSNERSAGALADRYRAFRETFVAPAHWLDVFYETEVARHFYTAKERAMFRKRWSSNGTPVSAPSEAADLPVLEAGLPGHPEPAASTEAASARRPEDSEAYVQHPADLQGRDETALELDRVRAELETLRLRLREGHAVDFNDYAYRPRERDWGSNAGASRLRTLFADGESAYAELLERFCTFDVRFRTIPVLPSADGPHWENWWLPGLDAVALYGLVATQAPRTYLEIGSGHSTRFVRRAIQDHGLSTRIVSIDPNPTADIEALCDEVVRVRCEDAPASVFAALEAGDMLFFDGSHRSFQNSDATVFFTEILPGLAPGVVYGLHDIFLPYDYPESWTNRFYNEQYLLMAYLLGGAGGDEIVFPAHHVWREPAYAALRNRLFLGSRHIDWLTSSFWMRRAGVPPGEA